MVPIPVRVYHHKFLKSALFINPLFIDQFIHFSHSMHTQNIIKLNTKYLYLNLQNYKDKRTIHITIISIFIRYLSKN